jgi:flagellar basal-body rod modification protein FlgD
MPVNSISSTSAPTPVTSSTASSTSAGTSTTSSSALNLGSSDFLKLLVTQLQNQDPLNPVSNTDFLAQLAQFSQLEAVTQLNTQFTDLLRLQDLTQGASLVGRDVIYQDLNSGQNTHGTVQAISVQNGQLAFLINGTTVSFDQIRGIALGLNS